MTGAASDRSHPGAMKAQLLSRIQDRSATVGIVGLGYVGLPLAMEFAKSGFKVIGYDVSDRGRVLKMGKEITCATI